MSTPVSKPTETILIVDDEREVLSVAADALGRLGYAVLSTEDPGAALRLARTSPEHVHLLMTDVVMPLMNGRELAVEFRAIRPEVKVLFMSAYSIESVEDYRIRLAPGEPFLAKPFTMTELATQVRAALAYRPPSAWPRVK